MIKVKISTIAIALLFTFGLSSPGLSSSPKPKEERIVSLTVGSDEILFDILGRANARGKIAALSSFATDSRYSNIFNKVSSINTFAGTQIESVIKLKPTLVIVASYSKPEFLTKLKQLSIPTLKLASFKSVSDIRKNILAIGKSTGYLNEARIISKRLDIIFKSPKRKKMTALVYSTSGYLMGDDTIIDDLLGQMHIENLIKDKGWPKISPEYIATLNPDIIIAPGQAGDKRKVLQSISNTPGWSHLEAVKSQKIIMVPERDLSSTSHYIVQAYQAIKAKIATMTKDQQKVLK